MKLTLMRCGKGRQNKLQAYTDLDIRKNCIFILTEDNLLLNVSCQFSLQ